MSDYTEHLISEAGGDVEPRPVLNYRKKEMIKIIARRVEHLRDKTSKAPEDWRGNDFDRAELGALKFALATIEAHYGVTP